MMKEQIQEARVRLAGKTYALPAIVNIFLPGIGQMLKGQVFGGFIVLVVVIGGYAAAVLVFPALISLAIHIGSIVNAYKGLSSSDIYREAKRIELDARWEGAEAPAGEGQAQAGGVSASTGKSVSASETETVKPVPPPVKGWGLIGHIINKNRGY